MGAELLLTRSNGYHHGNGLASSGSSGLLWWRKSRWHLYGAKRVRKRYGAAPSNQLSIRAEELAVEVLLSVQLMGTSLHQSNIRRRESNPL